jgi:pre-mRNA cleavage complex 2 protein Pcf11
MSVCIVIVKQQDKVKINSLSMVAEDHAGSTRSAAAIYDIIRQSLMSPDVNCDRKLPLVYVVDSILKNVKGEFIPTIENDAKNWMPIVFKALSDDKRAKLKKVWNLWKDANVFSSKEKWEEMGQCFSGGDSSGGDVIDNPILESAGISFGVRYFQQLQNLFEFFNRAVFSSNISPRTSVMCLIYSVPLLWLYLSQKDGGLVLMPSLRNAMQAILDDLQSDEQDELNKVSLERLAVIDPDLLIKIKRTAEDSVRSGTLEHAGGTGGGNSSMANETNSKVDTDVLSFLTETRTPETIMRSQTWKNASLNYVKDSHAIIASLNHLVLESASMAKRYTQTEAIEMTCDLATASVIATLLTNSLQQLKDLEDKSKRTLKTALTGRQRATGASQTPARSFFAVDKNLFTNEGVKKLNEAIVGLLYDIGLPFISSVDGRRFATQLDLSQHLDALFKKGQLEKSMPTTQERGWYDDTTTWCGDDQEKETIQKSGGVDGDDGSDRLTANDGNLDPDTFTTPADESRDCCVICGINFKMIFDNDDGIYKYNNAREIEVMNDEAAATESEHMLVHFTCWRNLGAPEILTADQTIS